MLRDWKLNLKVVLNRSSPTAIYLQIAQVIIQEIRRGRLLPGSVLPGSRELASELGVNRKTIINVYDELTAQGWLASNGTKGTFVSSSLPLMSDATIDQRSPRNHSKPAGPQFKRLTKIEELDVTFPEPGLFCLDDGTPDTRLFPVEHFARAYRSIMLLGARTGKLTYGDPRGSLALRQAISKMLNVDRGLATTADNICLTRGSQMAIYVTAKALIHSGDTAVVEELTYPPAREVFRSMGASVLRIRLTELGPDLDQFEATCRRHPVRLVYLTPHHHFPTTRLLRADQRLRLLALAEQFGFSILEDDYDHEFHFQRQPLLPLASIDPSKVVYIGSLSKLLSPHLRIGYLAAPANVIERAAREIMIIDRQGDQIAEAAVAELIESGELRRHARKALSIYTRRRDRLALLLEKEIGAAVNFRPPDGGLAFWLTFGDLRHLDRLEERAPSIGMKLLPSRSFSGTADGPRGLRVGFAGLNDAELGEAVKRLKSGIGVT